MVSTRSKRWNGNFDTLPTDFLKEVLAKMADYGERVQFSLVTGGPEPSYQILNEAGKAMAFDRNHHLLRPEGDEFAGANATRLYTLEQVKDGVAGVRVASAPRAARAARAAGTPAAPRTTAARLEEQYAAQRYEYYRTNRHTMPAGITSHTEEITALMRQGMAVEDAFSAVLKKHF